MAKLTELIKYAKELRSYFGENDKTIEQQMMYYNVNKIAKFLSDLEANSYHLASIAFEEGCTEQKKLCADHAKCFISWKGDDPQISKGSILNAPQPINPYLK